MLLVLALLALTSNAIEISIGDLIKVYELGKAEAAVGVSTESSLECEWHAAEEMCLEFEENMDQGGDKYTDGQTFESCGALCLERLGCNGYTFQMNNGRCWMKSGASKYIGCDGKNARKSQFKSCVECSWMEAADECLEFEENVMQGDAKFTDGHDFDSCGALCVGTAGCNGYTVQTNNGRCWLKSGTSSYTECDGNNYRKSQYKVCSSCVPKWTEEKVGECLDAEGSMDQDGAKYTVKGAGECFAACSASATCNGYTRQTDNDRCWLKDNAVGFSDCDGKNFRNSAYMTCEAVETSVGFLDQLLNAGADVVNAGVDVVNDAVDCGFNNWRCPDAAPACEIDEAAQNCAYYLQWKAQGYTCEYLTNHGIDCSMCTAQC